MAEKTESTIQLIDIDLEQWRRDINTFATTTQQALDAIANELSNSCNDGHASPSRSTVKTSVANTNLSRQPKTKRGPKTAESKSKINHTSKSSFGDDRLANIKEKLAQRLAKNNRSAT
jgi:hypothetical protein